MIVNLHSIRFRILVTVLVLIVFLFGITAALVIYVSLSTVNKMLIENNLSLSQAVSQNLATQLRFLMRSVEELAQMPGLYGADSGKQKDILHESLLFQPKDFDTLAIYDVQGQVTVVESVKPLFSSLGNIRELKEFNQVVETRKSMLTRAIITPGGRKIMMALAPLIDEADNLVGMIGGSIDLQESYINNLLAAITLPIGGQLFIVDTKGKIIFHPDRQQIGLPMPAGKLRAATGQEINNLAQLWDYDQFSGILSLPEEKKALISSAPISKFPLLTCILEDYENAYSLLQSHRIVLIALFLVSLIPAAILSFVLSRSIAKPIEQLTREVEAIGDGGYQRIRQIYKGEIGKLGMVFNQLLNRLNILISRLRESEVKYRNLFNNATDGIIVVDYNNWLIMDVNTRLAGMLTIDSKKIIGQPLNSLIKDKLLTKVIKEAVEKEDIRRIELNLSAAAKNPLFAEVTCTAMSYEGKNIVLINVKDITDRALVHKHIAQIEKMESIGVLASGIAHDFNNIMTGIIGYASLIKNKVDPNSIIYQYADTVEHSIIRAKEITGQLLEFARGEKTKRAGLSGLLLNVKLLLNDLSKVIGETFDKTITIDYSCGDSLFVNAEWSQLYEVVLNLCINARDAMPNGGHLTIKAYRSLLPRAGHLPRFSGKKDYVVIEIADTGHGIAPEIEEQIFEPFFTTKPPGEGTGLGLSVAYGIIKKYNGFIEVKSKLGEGATFYIYLPEATGKEEQVKWIGTKKPSPAETKHILVVDDEKTVAEVITNLLMANGFTVTTVSDSEQALRVYENQREEIDLAIIDLMLPKTDGKKLYQALKTIDHGIKVLFISGYNEQTKFAEVISEDGVEFLPKPFGEKELLRLVNSLLA